MKFGSIIPGRENAQSPARREASGDPFLDFRREMDRVFDDFFSGFGGLSRATGSQGFGVITPALDVSEDEKEIVVTAELPGLNEKDFEVTLAGDLLTIKGEKKDEREEKRGDAQYVERRFGSFSRSIRLPFEVRDENVEANYDNGVLTLRVPKPEDARRPVRRIEVKKA